MTPQDLDALEKRLRDDADDFANHATPIQGDGPTARLLREAADMIAELREARAVIDRLASSEAFDVPQAISGPLAAEMCARMDYARAFLARSTTQSGCPEELQPDRNGKGEGG